MAVVIDVLMAFHTVSTTVLIVFKTVETAVEMAFHTVEMVVLDCGHHGRDRCLNGIPYRSKRSLDSGKDRGKETAHRVPYGCRCRLDTGEHPGKEAGNAVPDTDEEILDGRPHRIPVRAEQSQECIRQAFKSVEDVSKGVLDELPDPHKYLLHTSMRPASPR